MKTRFAKRESVDRSRRRVSSERALRGTQQPLSIARPMQLRTGIPRLSELDAHLASDEYKRHVEFNRSFLERNDAAMSQYGKLWAKDTFRLWSRRWEYPFVAQRVIKFAGTQNDGPVRVLDA